MICLIFHVSYITRKYFMTQLSPGPCTVVNNTRVFDKKADGSFVINKYGNISVDKMSPNNETVLMNDHFVAITELIIYKGYYLQSSMDIFYFKRG